MARIKYREINFGHDRAQRIVAINKIIQQYKGAVTVRQVYYRLVAAGVIPNNKGEYDKVQDLITDARYAGLIDWNAIEDRNRAPWKIKDWPSARQGLDELAENFRLESRWDDQEHYVELWVEKAALEGVLQPIASDYHVTLMANRGYSSASAMKDCADRLRHFSSVTLGSRRRKPVILYVGDFDPSGLHMITDVKARLFEFGVPSDLDVRPVALTWEQIQEYNPPPAPVKLTDSRANDFIAAYGDSCWEADALPPDRLDLVVRQTLNSYIDKKKMKSAITRENLIKQQIKKLAAGFVEPKETKP